MASQWSFAEILKLVWQHAERRYVYFRARVDNPVAS